MPSITLPIAFSVILFPGVLLVFVPFFPALSYMLVVAIAFVLLTGFSLLLPYQLGILVVLTIASLCVDWSAGVLGAKYGGAHAKSIWWGILGMIVGTLLFPPFGGIVGLFVAILITEKNLRNKTHGESLKAASGALLGTITGMGINAFLALTFFLLFIGFLFI